MRPIHPLDFFKHSIGDIQIFEGLNDFTSYEIIKDFHCKRLTVLNYAGEMFIEGLSKKIGWFEYFRDEAKVWIILQVQYLASLYGKVPIQLQEPFLQD